MRICADVHFFNLTPELLCGILMLDSTEVFREVFYGKVQLFRICVCI